MQPIYSGWPDRGFVLDGVLDAGACTRLVAEATAQGFAATAADYPPSYRDNDRLVRDDPRLAAWLFDRVRARLPAHFTDRSGGEHELVGLNERFRFCRYQGGQSFRIHRDGAHAPSADVRSRLTLQIYLDDGFVGGHTRFYASRHGACLAAVQPVAGSAIVFGHDLWHDGEPVTAGVKHVLRTDVLYRATERSSGRATECSSGRATERSTEHARREHGETAHRGYVYAAALLADGRLCTASRDRTLGIGGARVDSGHTASVHALVESRPGLLLTGARDRTVRALDLSTGASREVGRHDGAVLCLARHGAGVASGGGDGAIVLRDAGGAAQKTLRGHTGWVWSLASVGGHLVSGSEDGSLRLWNEHGCVDASWLGRGPVHALAALGHEDQERFVAGYADGHVVEWRIRCVRGEPRLESVDVLHALDGEIYALCPLDDGRLAVGGEHDVARVFRGGTCVRELPHEGFVRTLVQLPDGRLASGGYDGEVRLW